MQDWIDEDLPDVQRASWGAEGVRVSRSLVPWDSVLDVIALPEGEPTELYVLAPRRPPRPPWFRLRRKDLEESLQDEDLSDLARQARTRAHQRGYRGSAAGAPPLPPDELLRRVLEREDLPGALEIPVGRGPESMAAPVLRAGVSAAAGSAAGIFWAAMLHPAWVGGLAAAGAVVGALAPQGRRIVTRRRRHRPRVLVLAPDGCVVGFPSGVRAFAWDQIERFEAVEWPLPGRVRPAIPQLQVTLADGEGGGRIAAAWFDGPLPLIVAVAEAYRTRRA